MRVNFWQDQDGKWVTEVVLSRRNLLALLAKLDGYPEDSACTLSAPSMYPATVIRAEENDAHYAHPSRRGAPPGRLHPQTAAMIEDSLAGEIFKGAT